MKTPSTDPVVITLLVLALLFGFAILPRVFRPPEDAWAGKEAPDFELELLANGTDGAKTLALHELRGKAVVLDFWATWCGPCQAEAPILNRFAERLKDRGVTVVGISTSDDATNARTFTRSHALGFPIVYDARQSAAKSYGVENLPTLVIVSRSGKILAVRAGLTDDAELEALTKQAL